MSIDYKLLAEQRTFLTNYPWHENAIPEKVEGVLNLLDSMLDENETLGGVLNLLDSMLDENEALGTLADQRTAQ